MRNYLDALKLIMETGVDKPNRTGVPTRGIFGLQLRFPLNPGRDVNGNRLGGFPLVTTKKVPFRSIAAELLSFVRGYDNVRDFNEAGTKIWDANAEAPYWKESPHYKGDGDLGRIYGVSWNRFRGIEGPNEHGDVQIIEANQLQDLLHKLKNDPNDRRMLVTAWNPVEVATNQMALPPCHVLFQCYVADGKLSLMMYQRSCDMFLGVPFNIASYAMLTHMLAHQTGLKVGELILSLADAHIYHNHFPQVYMQLDREPMELPILGIRERHQGLWDYDVGDFDLQNYNPHPALYAEMVV